jgi:uncharacterized MAPEG superfamily protein
MHMTSGLPESLFWLMASALLGIVHFFWATFAARAYEKDTKWALSPRDTPKPLGGLSARLDRSYRNFLETYPYFIIGMILLPFVGILSGPAVWAGAIYVAMRLIYVPAYAFGWAIRPYVWMVATLAILVSFGYLIEALLNR